MVLMNVYTIKVVSISRQEDRCFNLRPDVTLKRHVTGNFSRHVGPAGTNILFYGRPQAERVGVADLFTRCGWRVAVSAFCTAVPVSVVAAGPLDDTSWRKIAITSEKRPLFWSGRQRDSLSVAAYC